MHLIIIIIIIIILGYKGVPENVVGVVESPEKVVECL